MLNLNNSFFYILLFANIQNRIDKCFKIELILVSFHYYLTIVSVFI